jgi:hypothetical protein
MAWASRALGSVGSSSDLCSRRHTRRPPKPEPSSGARCVTFAQSMPAPSADVVAVHPRYTRDRQIGECSGHQRSQPVPRNCRSARQPDRHQAALQQAGRSSSLPPGCREPFGLLPTRRWSPRASLPLRPSREPSPTAGAIAARTGRATNVRCRAWANRSSPTMRAKRAPTLDRLLAHLGLQ